MSAGQVIEIIKSHRDYHIKAAGGWDKNGNATQSSYYHAAVVVLDSLLDEIRTKNS